LNIEATDCLSGLGLVSVWRNGAVVASDEDCASDVPEDGIAPAEIIGAWRLARGGLACQGCDDLASTDYIAADRIGVECMA
jgi:hypothetical protein